MEHAVFVVDTVARVVASLNAQDLSSHEHFVAKHSLTVPLLADVDKRVARAYSALTPGIGTTKRVVIVIDEQCVVRHRHDHMLGLDFQTVDELRTMLEALPGPTAPGTREQGTRESPARP